ncbi:hypothetical protein Tco_1134704 [Tanacetum coccineum]
MFPGVPPCFSRFPVSPAFLKPIRLPGGVTVLPRDKQYIVLHASSSDGLCLLLPVACNDVLLESETKEDNHGSESESHNDRHKVDKLLLKKNAIGLEVKDEHMADAENNFQFLNEHEIQRW